MLILVLPLSSASVQITNQLKDEYSLGDLIPLSIKIVPQETTDALVKLTLKCTNKEVSYYVAPLSLKENKEESINAPTIKAFSEGLCTIRVNIESMEGSNIDGTTSKEFTVSDELDLSFTIDKTEALPGDKIKIQGTAKKKESKIEDGLLTISLDNKANSMDLKSEDFSYELHLEDNIKSGEHSITVEVQDSYGNYNQDSKTISIKAIPTKLEFELNKKEFKPKETIKLTIILLDQADDPINEDIEVKLLREKSLFKDEIVIFGQKIKANKEFEFTFSPKTPPNEYILKSSFDSLKNEDTIEILPNPEIETRLEGDIVYIKNIGNVEFNEKTAIMLEKDGKTFLINKKIKLDVDGETTIDLSKEVPSGSYKVTLPETEDVVEEGSNQQEVIENVEIEDDRSAAAKGLGAITGGVVAGAGLLLDNPKLATILIIIILLSLIGYFNRESIENVIKKIREKRENN